MLELYLIPEHLEIHELPDTIEMTSLFNPISRKKNIPQSMSDHTKGMHVGYLAEVAVQQKLFQNTTHPVEV